MKSPYSEIILRHSKNPSNWGLPDGSVEIRTVRNRSCGDLVKIGMVLDSSGRRILQIGHESEGCMLCRAAASIMCASLEGQKLDDVKVLRNLALKLSDFGEEMPDSAEIEGVFTQLSAVAETDAGEGSGVLNENAAGEKGHQSPKKIAEIRKDFEAFAEVRQFPTRKRCMTLPWEYFRDLLL